MVKWRERLPSRNVAVVWILDPDASNLIQRNVHRNVMFKQHLMSERNAINIDHLIYNECCSNNLSYCFVLSQVTTDLHHKCTEEFKGTSSAAPLAAGMFALVLQAKYVTFLCLLTLNNSSNWNVLSCLTTHKFCLTIVWFVFSPNLSWRDVQHLVVETAQVTSPVDEGWMKNGAGYHFNHKFGFGRLDAGAMVKRAKTWKSVAPQRTCHGPSSQTQQWVMSMSRNQLVRAFAKLAKRDFQRW